MATTQRRRALTQPIPKTKALGTTRRQPNGQSKTTAADQLADALATQLTISNEKGKKKALESQEREPSDEEKRVASMRAVNAASQTLSSVVQSGWKKSTDVPARRQTAKKGSLSTAMDAAESVSRHLAVLRSLSPNDLNVERAAISIVGKLMSVEMYDAASSALKGIYPRLCAHLNVSLTSSQQQEPLSYISLSMQSPSASKADSTLLTVISTYLTYSLTIVLESISNTAKNIRLLADILSSTGTSPDDGLHNSQFQTLLSWLPSFTSLPSKHIDALLPRAYNSLTKFCTTSLSPPVQRPSSRKPLLVDASLHRDAYRIRMYALQCLAHATDGVVAPGTIWEQVIRFGTSYVKSIASQSNSENESVATQTILNGCSRIVESVEALPDCERLLKEKAFVSFLEWWMAFARRASDLQSLNKISSLMRTALESSTSSTHGADRPTTPVTDGPSPEQATEVSSKEDAPKTTEALVMRSAHICALFTQIAILIDLIDRGTDAQDLIARAHEVLPLFSTSKSLQDLLIACYSPGPSNSSVLKRAGDKCDRAMEKIRQGAMKALGATSVADCTKTEVRGLLVRILEGCVDFFERTSRSHPCLGFFTRFLDTLFVLARSTLIANDPRTHDPAYRYVERAVKLLQLDQEKADNIITGLGAKELANYTRCVSGTFHNLAGILYQAGRHGTAVGFLVDGCRLGQRALCIHQCDLEKPKDSKSENPGDGTANQREADGWRQLEEQIHRRWELLGACYIKIGDRKNAYAAFVECIKAFPYDKSGFAGKARCLGLDALFGSSSALKQLANIIDRMTYMATCELFLDPAGVSLSQPSLWTSMKRPGHDVIGALLERQVHGLEASRWKPNVKLAVAQLLLDSSEVYGAETMPIRRARILLRWLEFAYHGGSTEGLEGDIHHLGTAAEVAKEIECLLTQKDFAADSGLVIFCSQYRASAHLWCTLHAHYKGDMNQNSIIAEHANQASSILKKLLGDLARSEPRKSTSQSPPKKPAPKRGGPSGRKVTVGFTGSRARVAKRVTVKEPVTPKPKTRAVLQAISLNEASPPKKLLDSNAGLVIDDFERFIRLLQTVTRILGLMAFILPKVHILDVTRKLCERYVGTSSDGYVSASIELAHEYVKLGKLRRASAVFNHALDSVRSGQVSDDVCALFLLRYAEALAVLEDLHLSSSVYCEALVSSQRCIVEDKNMPTLQMVQLRVKRLERAAMAAQVFGLIQYSQNDIVAALDGMLQSLRIWNRAVDTLARLNPSPSFKEPEADKDVFEVVSLKEALPAADPSQEQPQMKKLPRPLLDSLEWRVSEGLLSTLFSLCQAYLFRGSAKEAEYFAQQAHDVSQSLNAPALLSRALAKKGEILLQLGKLEEAHECLEKASEILANIPGIDSADICRLRGDHSQRMANHEDAQQMYVETTTMLEQLDTAFRNFDGLALGPRKSAGLAPTDKPAKEMIVPDLLASVLRQQIWLLRDEGGDEYMGLLEKLMALPYSSRTKAEENALMAQLTLHNVYSRFRNDMFLSSLCESAIALPMGMINRTKHTISAASQDLLNILDSAATLFWSNLSLIAANGSVPDVRNAMTSLALISAFQTSLGRPGRTEAILAARLIDLSSSVTLQRELLEAIPQKFLNVRSANDLEWPLITTEGKPLPRPSKNSTRTLFDTSDDDEEDPTEKLFKDYWDRVRVKYQAYDVKKISPSPAQQLPCNWTVVHINVTGDKSTLFVSRQWGGPLESPPLIFCVPLKGRRDNGTGDEDENHLTFEDALAELRVIVKLSDEGTRAASRIDPEDELARTQWWKERRDLDQRLKGLLHNIEFCWLGAFKTILNAAPDHPPEVLTELRTKLERLFQQCLGLRDKQSKTRSRKNGSPAPTVSPSDLTLDDALIECFSTLSPKCKDEELEDLIYFVFDLYQFHGVRVAIAEIDMVRLALDLRSALEEHVGRVRKFDQQNATNSTAKRSADKDEHTFLVLGKDLQGIPWESMPVLHGRSVSRVPSLSFLLDRIEFVNCQCPTHPPLSNNSTSPFGAHIDPRRGYYVLNPSGDLGRTQERFSDWAKDMEKVGWKGTIGQPPSEQEFLDNLQRQDLVIYFGHGGGEQYVRTHKIRNLTRCAATMLWGCSSGTLREMGDFDRTGTPNSYFIAGCPTLVANLWDVTDKDIDKFSCAVFEKLRLSAAHLRESGESRHPLPTTSVVTAVAKSREVCKLPYLTGAAPVVYGIPFYL